MKRRSSRRRVVIERDETRFHIGETSSSDDEANGNMRRGAEDENTFAGVRQVLLWHKTYFRTKNYSVHVYVPLIQRMTGVNRMQSTNFKCCL